MFSSIRTVTPVLRKLQFSTPTVKLLTMSSFSTSSNASKNLYDFVLDDLEGVPVSLKKYEGQVVLIENSASK